jgi:hypothetical protein
MADSDLTPSRNPQVVYRDLANEEGGLLLHLESGQYHGVNATGFAIWELIDGRRTISDISDALSEQGETGNLIAEVSRFIEELRHRDLVGP